MKIIPQIFILLLVHNYCLSQCQTEHSLELQDGNDVRAVVVNRGNLFNTESSYGGFSTQPLEDFTTSNIFTAGLWLAGISSDGEIRASAATYGSNNGRFDYAPGPYTPDSILESEHCENWNRLWKVTQSDIEQHQSDFADNGQIDNPTPSVYEWPGKGNVHFFNYNNFLLPETDKEWAPFYDMDQNGIYNPENGDYPHPPNTVPSLSPESLIWTVFHDNFAHLQVLNGEPLHVEVHQTSWSFYCYAEPELNNTVFTSHKIINKSGEPIDSFRVGLFVDFDLGCFLDDYLGCDTLRNAIFSYNSDELDGVNSTDDCLGVSTYDAHLPTQSVKWLNQPLNSFMWYYHPSILPPISAITNPVIPEHYFNYLNGYWLDGTPNTYGGEGYNPDGEAFPFAFPGNPNDPDGWSMITEDLPDNDRKALGAYHHGTLDSEASIQLDLAFTHHVPYQFGYEEVISRMYPQLEYIQHLYNLQFNTLCGAYTSTNTVNTGDYKIFPNPTNGKLNINSPLSTIKNIQVIDINGKIRLQWRDLNLFSTVLDLSDLSPGIYYLRLEYQNSRTSQKVILH